MATTPKPAAVESIKRGQAVVIRIVSNGVAQPAYTGVFLGYWRNDRYWVREDEYGTASTYYANEIHAVEEGAE